MIEIVRLGRPVRGEIREMHDEARTEGCHRWAAAVNNSIQLALTRTSGLSEVDGRQDTDQYQRSVVRGMGMQVSP